jgi:hypothetical protein
VRSAVPHRRRRGLLRRAALAADPTGGLANGALAVCFPSFDAALIGDTVTCTVLAAQ